MTWQSLIWLTTEVMRHHSITSDEYDSRTLEGVRSIYLPQPNPMFEPTHYDERAAHIMESHIMRGLEWKVLTGFSHSDH